MRHLKVGHLGQVQMTDRFERRLELLARRAANEKAKRDAEIERRHEVLRQGEVRAMVSEVDPRDRSVCTDPELQLPERIGIEVDDE